MKYGDVKPNNTKRIQMLLGTKVGIYEDRQSLFIVELMSREDALQNDDQGSYYLDEPTDCMPDLEAFMRRSNGLGRVYFTFAFVGADALKKVATEVKERGERGTITMSD